MPRTPIEPAGTPGWGSPRRWGVFLVGCAALFSGIAMSINAGLGVGSWQVLETGLVSLTGAGFGTIILVEAAVCLAVAWVWLGQRPWIATALLAAGGVPIGMLVDALPTPEALVAQIAMLAVGLVMTAIGVAFYLASDLGASAQDTLFVGIYRRWPIRPGIVRFGIDASVVLTGMAIGGQFGVGTLVVTIVGPALIEPALRVGHHLAGTPLPPGMRKPLEEAVTTTPADLLAD